MIIESNWFRTVEWRAVIAWAVWNFHHAQWSITGQNSEFFKWLSWDVIEPIYYFRVVVSLTCANENCKFTELITHASTLTSSVFSIQIVLLLIQLKSMEYSVFHIHTHIQKSTAQNLMDPKARLRRSFNSKRSKRVQKNVVK